MKYEAINSEITHLRAIPIILYFSFRYKSKTKTDFDFPLFSVKYQERKAKSFLTRFFIENKAFPQEVLFSYHKSQ